MNSRFSLPIGTKIFGIATGMLTLLLGVTCFNYIRIRSINRELSDIADYLAPITENVATINVHALEQAIHFERILRHYETIVVDLAQVNVEKQAFIQKSRWVDEEIEDAIQVAKIAEQTTYTPKHLLAVARLRPLLDILEEDHQQLNDQSLDIIQLLAAGDQEEADLLSAQLTTFEDEFDERLQSILFELSDLIEVSAHQAQTYEQHTLRVSWSLALIASSLGITFASLVTVGLVKPIHRLLATTQSVESGNLNVELSVSSGDEIGQLTESFNTMVSKLREKERLKTTFGQYVDPRLVDTLVAQNAQSEIGQRQMMTLFFSDIAGFSSLSEMLTPVGLVNLINQYLTLASEPIKERGGVINQFIGDAVSAFWGPPFVDVSEHAKLACYAALEQFDQLIKLRRRLPDLLGIRKGLPHIDIRIGLASGEVLAGNIGSERSKSYTVMGPAAQIAEILEGANKQYGTHILITSKTAELAEDSIVTREIDCISLIENKPPEPIYELLGILGYTESILINLCSCFHSALMAYRTKNWSVAESLFRDCLALVPNDGPSAYYLAQIAKNR